MSLWTELLVVNAVVPVATAFVVRRLAERCGPTSWIGPRSGPLAVAIAYAIGYSLLPPWAALIPTRHWHWLPGLGLLAGLVSLAAPRPLSQGSGRLLLRAGLSVVSAQVLVPTWPDLYPPRTVHIAGLSAGLFAIAAGLDPLLEGAQVRARSTVLAVCAATVAGVAATFVSFTYGQLAGLAAASFAGLAAAGRETGRSGSALGPAYAVLVVGAAYIASVEPVPPAPGPLIAAFAPLSLGLAAPIGRLLGSPPTLALRTLLLGLALASAVLVGFLPRR